MTKSSIGCHPVNYKRGMVVCHTGLSADPSGISYYIVLDSITLPNHGAPYRTIKFLHESGTITGRLFSEQYLEPAWTVLYDPEQND